VTDHRRRRWAVTSGTLVRERYWRSIAAAISDAALGDALWVATLIDQLVQRRHGGRFLWPLQLSADRLVMSNAAG